MKYTQLLTLATAALLHLSASASVREVWTFSAPDGTSLNKVMSNEGTAFFTSGTPITSIRDNQLEFSYDGETPHTFRQMQFHGDPVKDGICEVSWTFSKIDFTKTAAVKGSGNVGIDIRDLKGTRSDNSDDVILGGLRLRFDKKDLQIQYKAHDANEYESIAQMPVAQLEDNLQVRLRFDLNEPTKPGAFKIFLKLWGEDEINPVHSDTLPAGALISGFRVIQQTTNGKNDWQAGDTVLLDDFALSVF